MNETKFQLIFFFFPSLICTTGPEWDSSDEEQENISQTKSGKKKLSIAERKRSKKEANKKQGNGQQNNEEEDDTDAPTVIYIGHLPNEFEEPDLRKFLSQFGDVINSRISRSVKTGGSRGYAFVKFADPEVAKIVAETMQGYFLGKRRLVCHLVTKTEKGMFYNTDKVIAKRKRDLEVERKQREQNLASLSKLKEITGKLVAREKKKRKKFQELGIDYDFPGYEGSAVNVIDDEEESVVSEEVKVEKTSKKTKRKDSISSETSESKKKSKRKDSVGSESSSSKKKRKDSITSTGSAASSSSEKKKKKKTKKKKSM